MENRLRDERPEDMNPGTMQVLRITRTFKNSVGKEITRTELVRTNKTCPKFTGEMEGNVGLYLSIYISIYIYASFIYLLYISIYLFMYIYLSIYVYLYLSIYLYPSLPPSRIQVVTNMRIRKTCYYLYSYYYNNNNNNYNKYRTAYIVQRKADSVQLTAYS